MFHNTFKFLALVMQPRPVRIIFLLLTVYTDQNSGSHLRYLHPRPNRSITITLLLVMPFVLLV